jgi:hypothetical protein
MLSVDIMYTIFQYIDEYDRCHFRNSQLSSTIHQLMKISPDIFNQLISYKPLVIYNIISDTNHIPYLYVLNHSTLDYLYSNNITVGEIYTNTIDCIMDDVPILHVKISNIHNLSRIPHDRILSLECTQFDNPDTDKMINLHTMYVNSLHNINYTIPHIIVKSNSIKTIITTRYGTIECPISWIYAISIDILDMTASDAITWSKNDYNTDTLYLSWPGSISYIDKASTSITRVYCDYTCKLSYLLSKFPNLKFAQGDIVVDMKSNCIVNNTTTYVIRCKEDINQCSSIYSRVCIEYSIDDRDLHRLLSANSNIEILTIENASNLITLSIKNVDLLIIDNLRTRFLNITNCESVHIKSSIPICITGTIDCRCLVFNGPINCCKNVITNRLEKIHYSVHKSYIDTLPDLKESSILNIHHH